MMFDARGIFADIADGLTPDTQLSVSAAAARYMHVGSVGGYQGPWLADKTPYMREVMDATADRRYQSVIYMSGAQDGKTEGLIGGRIAYSIKCEASDVMLIGPDRDFVIDFSDTRLSRLIDMSPDLSPLLLRGQSSNKKMFKRFRNGAALRLGYPTASKLSGRSSPVMLLTEIDRMRMNLSGQGAAYDMAVQRVKSFGSKGKVIAESTPGLEVKTSDYELPNPHHVPPADGVAALYMLGDRRRWYWTCAHCGENMLVVWEGIKWDTSLSDSPDEAAETAYYACEHCGGVHFPKERQALNMAGRWLSEYDVYGTGPRNSRVASFWKEGPAAGFMSWQYMLKSYLAGQAHFERTGSQEKLRTFFNLDVGRPYLPISAQAADAQIEAMKSRATGVLIDKGVVPKWVKFLVTAIDVQQNRFEVQVMGYAEDYQCAVVNRYAISKSERVADDGVTRLPLRPGVFAEDWMRLDDVLRKEYTREDGEVMSSALTVCDSGGSHESTKNAYLWAAGKIKAGWGGKLALTKGASSQGAKRVFAMKAEVPLIGYNPNLIKDEVAAALERDTKGPSYIEIPGWLPAWFFEELTAEERGANGRWAKRNPKARNEAFDLLVLSRVALTALRYEAIKWGSPPAWVTQTEQANTVVKKKPGSVDVSGFERLRKMRGQ